MRDAPTALTPVLVKPGMDKAIALAPAFVGPQDGALKQDGELNAAKRWLAANGAALSPLNVTVLGDDLFCHEPFCRAVLGQHLNFILVCKPSSHATVEDWLDFLQRRGGVRTLTQTRWSGRWYWCCSCWCSTSSRACSVSPRFEPRV